MKNHSTKKLALAGVLCAVAVVGSVFISFPVLGSKCSPTQHMVNVLCAVFLGPGYGVGVAFTASLLRNIMGVGSVVAFPGSMCGALLCGLACRRGRHLTAALAGEVVGTGVLGGLAAYPIARAFLDPAVIPAAFYGYMVPFLISTVAGSLLAGALVAALQKSGALGAMKIALEH